VRNESHARDGLPDWVQDWLSRPRLASYVAAAGAADALDLYAWNCRASTALFELIGWFEVAWRNNIDRAICAGRRHDARHWLFDRSFPSQPRTWSKVASAIKTVQHGTHRPTSGQVIAELSLGFWRFTASGYRQTVWLSYLSHAFPHAHHRPRPADMDRQLEAIIKLRNRIAHHEPLGPVVAIRHTVADILAIGTSISPDMAHWWRRRTAVWHVLERRPSTQCRARPARPERANPARHIGRST
jgi:hypothetical protein